LHDRAADQYRVSGGAMSRPGYEPYLPQGEPRLVADGLWIVDGPEIAYRLGPVTLPCPTRMTVVGLAEGSVLLHSPTSFTPILADRLNALGSIDWLVAPNAFHYTHLAAWADAYPTASVLIAPDLDQKLGVAVAARQLIGDQLPTTLAADLDHLLVPAGPFSEAVFFHRRSRSLIVTDLVQNFEAKRITNPLTRLILRAGGATGPGGQASIEVRMAARPYRKQLRAAVETMISWAPERIILAHGRCYEGNAVAELNRAFAWV